MLRTSGILLALGASFVTSLSWSQTDKPGTDAPVTDEPVTDEPKKRADAEGDPVPDPESDGEVEEIEPDVPSDDGASDVKKEDSRAEPTEGGDAAAEQDQQLEGEDPEAEEGEAALFSRTPAAGKGAIVGVLRDTRREPLPEATVTVVGHKTSSITDEEGRFRLELAPGRYTLRFFYELHRPSLVKDLLVRSGKIEHVDGELTPDEDSVETFEVQAEADTSSLEGQVLARQRSAAVGDGMGRTEISKSPASNAAQAAQRVVGASIVGSRFVYVRGLGERYTNALLNDAPLPSPEPDRAAVPLDLFPALILDNLTIVKTFTPDVPADFAGGSVRIQTRELPSKPLFQASLGFGFDDRTTFRERLAQRGSNTDFLGFDSGLRALPGQLRNRSLLELPAQDQLAAARDLNSYMSARSALSLPNHALSAVIGNGWKLGGQRRLGAMLTFNYGRTFTLRDDLILRTFRQVPAANGRDTELRSANDYRGELGVDRVSWGSLGSVSYWPSDTHRFTLLGMHTQLADSSAQIVQGYNDSRSADIANTRLRYVSRALNFLQLKGEHDAKAWNAARFEWTAALSHASRDEPDTRDTVFQATQGSDFTSVGTPENGSHLFTRQGELTFGAGLDYTQPFSQKPDASKLKLGFLLSQRERDFNAKRYHFGAIPGAPVFSCGPTYTPACSDDLYTTENVGRALELIEDTRPEDAYQASLGVYAAYAMLDIGLTNRLRVVAGPRLEVTRQSIDPYSQFAGTAAPKGAQIDSADLLPAIALSYASSAQTKLRVSLTRTLARPQIRELSPFEFTDYFGARPYAGNPDLKLTYINNADLRFEYYPTQREVMAFSFFFKDFQNPIENVVLDSGADGSVKPQNARGGRLLGVELEARKSLGDLHKALEDFSLIANLTLSRSRIDIDTGARFVQVTNPYRAMVNQAPIVANIALDYENPRTGSSVRLLYNVSGKRIVEVGTRGLPDSYEHPRHMLDLNLNQRITEKLALRLAAANLLGVRSVVTAGDRNVEARVQQAFRESRLFTVNLTYTH